jgi:hypothetical protein
MLAGVLGPERYVARHEKSESSPQRIVFKKSRRGSVRRYLNLYLPAGAVSRPAPASVRSSKSIRLEIFDQLLDGPVFLESDLRVAGDGVGHLQESVSIGSWTRSATASRAGFAALNHCNMAGTSGDCSNAAILFRTSRHIPFGRRLLRGAHLLRDRHNLKGSRVAYSRPRISRVVCGAGAVAGTITEGTPARTAPYFPFTPNKYLPPFGTRVFRQ